ncbi:hypothetical protein TRVA0_031S00804 [Trichomonascus vanleenenianus]|uniref:beta-N-acetylhexosaminidase n=1 Tax=Trichomonascus vanleenenianus TaxID=2268995 RepID=UPI003ECB131F
MRCGFVFTAIFIVAVVFGQVRVNPLPAPRNITWGSSGAIPVNVGYLKISGTQHPVFKAAAKRTLADIAKLHWVPQPVQVDRNILGVTNVTDIKVVIKDEHADLQFAVDETYELYLPSGSKTLFIGSETVWGALHALSTLQQIVISDGNGGYLIEQPVRIRDRPLYPHRGLLVDTARSYIPISALKRQVDAMALSKLNVLHWHFEDVEAWPLEVPGVDTMAKGAYAPSEVFHASDVKAFVEYARERGVRVIPEIEVPAHLGEGWLQAFPDCVLCSGKCCGQIDVLNPACYDALSKVYKGTASLFKDNVFHIGGDEIASECWGASDHVKKWMEADGSRTWRDVTQYYIDHSLPIFHNTKNRKLILWEDIVIGDVRANHVPKKDLLVQAWHHSAVKNLTKLGYDVIASPNEFVYLDCGFGAILPDDSVDVQQDPSPGTPSYNYGGDGGSWCAPYKSWQRVYVYDVAYNLTSDETRRVKGIEAALWGELNDETTIDSKLWPRAASLAEVAWSGNKDSHGKSRLLDFAPRLYNFRQLLKATGLGASPVTVEFCWRHPNLCNML